MNNGTISEHPSVAAAILHVLRLAEGTRETHSKESQRVSALLCAACPLALGKGQCCRPVWPFGAPSFYMFCTSPRSSFNRGKAADACHLAALVSSPGARRGAPPALIGSLLSRLHCQICFKVMFYTFAKIKTTVRRNNSYFSSFPFTCMIPTVQGATWMARTDLVSLRGKRPVMGEETQAKILKNCDEICLNSA